DDRSWPNRTEMSDHNECRGEPASSQALAHQGWYSSWRVPPRPRSPRLRSRCPPSPAPSMRITRYRCRLRVQIQQPRKPAIEHMLWQEKEETNTAFQKLPLRPPVITRALAVWILERMLRQDEAATAYGVSTRWLV